MSNSFKEIKSIDKNNTIFDSVYLAMTGFIRVFRKETSIKYIFFTLVLAITIAVLNELSLVKVIIISYLWLNTLILEINNTALELDMDFTGDKKFHPEIKRVKDYAAATVLLSSSFAIIVSYIFIFIK